MGRAIITSRSNANPQLEGTPAPDRYRDRLFKYIPGEVITLYLGLSAIVAAAENSSGFMPWLIFLVGLIGTPFYLRFMQEVRSAVQLGVSTLAFVVWVFALGGPFTQWAGYEPVYGAVLLPVFTFFVAVIPPPPGP
jgi:hypothetical protein